MAFAFIIVDQAVFASRSVFHLEDVQDSMTEGEVVGVLGRPKVWPDSGELLVQAKAIG